MVTRWDGLQLLHSLIILILFNFNTAFGDYPNFTKKERVAIDKLRPLIRNYIVPEYMKTDSYHLRVLKASKFDMDNALEMVKKISKWRNENKMDGILNEDLTSYRRLPSKVEGIDKEGSPIFWAQFGKWDLRRYVLAGIRDIPLRKWIQDLEKTEHQIYEFQKMGQNMTTFYGIVDMEGYNLNQHGCLQCLSMSMSMIRAVALYYPSFLKKGVIINAPRFSSPVSQLIKQMLPTDVSRLVTVYGRNTDEWQSVILMDISANEIPEVFGGTRTI